MRYQRPTGFYAFTVLFLFLICGASPETATAQWATNGANINNTNSGSVGIGTANPNGGQATERVLQIGDNLIIENVVGNQTLFSHNAYHAFDGSWKYATSDAAQAMRMYSGSIAFHLAAAGTAGTAMSNWDGSDIKMVIKNSGHVGVGATNPGATFHVTSAGGATPFAGAQTFWVDTTATNKQSLIGFRDSATLQWFVGSRNGVDAPANRFSIFNANGAAEMFSITQGGNVGIGTTNPLAKLQIQGLAGADGAAKYVLQAVDNAPAAAGAGGGIAFTGNYLGANLANFGGIQGIKENATSGNYAGALLFTTRPYGLGMTEMMRISSVGYVGIGTPAPAYKLDVNGEINATGLRINGTPLSSVSTQWTTSGSNVYYNTGNIGVGTTSPAVRFDVHQPNGAAIRALSGSLSTHTSIQIGRTQAEGLLGIAATTGQYAADASAGDVILRTEAGDKKLLFTNGPNAATLAVASTGVGVTGYLNVTGAITGGTINAKYQDVAEWVESSQQLAAGTVVALDPVKSNQVLASSEAYDTKVAGVISAQPGISLGESGAGKVLVATTGRVKVRVDATRAPIKIGDLLVTSDVAGVAMKSVAVEVGGAKFHRPGTIIGKALEPLEKGTGEILVLLSLQ